MRLALPIALALGALLVQGCQVVDSNTASFASLTYTEDARAAYGEAMLAYRNKDWEDARALFEQVQKLFAYSRYARLAELRIADVDFEQAKYSDAIAGYREFVKSHPMDKDVEYARYRTTKALYRDIEDSLLMPPQEERDQSTTLEAYRELGRFVQEYPNGRYSDDARFMLRAVTGRLVRHELYVARFYLRKDAFQAAAARVDYALKNYPNSDLDSEALVLKGETLLKMHRWDEARRVLKSVVDEHGGPFAIIAKRFLDQIPQGARGPSTAESAPSR
jgi:outer membrane protein assembly factor BamD